MVDMRESCNFMCNVLIFCVIDIILRCSKIADMTLSVELMN